MRRHFHVLLLSLMGLACGAPSNGSDASESNPSEDLRAVAYFYLEYQRNELSNGYDRPSSQLSVTIGPLHERLVEIRAEDEENGWYVVGGFEQVRIISVDIDEANREALLQFCLSDRSLLLYQNGLPVGLSGDPTPRVGFLFAVMTESGWKFDEIIFENKRCDPALYTR